MATRATGVSRAWLALSVASLTACSEAASQDDSLQSTAPETEHGAESHDFVNQDAPAAMQVGWSGHEACDSMALLSVRGLEFDVYEGVMVRAKRPALRLDCEGVQNEDRIEHGAFHLWLAAHESGDEPTPHTENPGAGVFIYLDLNGSETHDLSEPDWESADGTFYSEPELRPADFARKIPLVVRGSRLEKHEGSVAHVAKCPARSIEHFGAAACQFMDGRVVSGGTFAFETSLHIERPTALLYVWLGSSNVGPLIGDPYFGATLTGPPCTLEGHLTNCSLTAEHFSIF